MTYDPDEEARPGSEEHYDDDADLIEGAKRSSTVSDHDYKMLDRP
jgi:hypothetical protein